MFKVGDIIWAKESEYSLTFYHRPCKVLKCLGSVMRVQILDNGSNFVVDAYKFELVPEGGILEPDDVLIHSTTRKKLIFIKYHECDYINCRNLANEVKLYKIQDIERYRAIFYV